MEKRPLGNSGLEVSPIALGTWSLGGAVESWGQVDDNESIAAIGHAIDCGINLIDTAPIYGLGHAETIVGKAIRGRRDEVVLATKCGLGFPTREGEQPRRSLASADIVRECEESLRRLQTDVIDVYLCHWPDPATPILETMASLMELKEQGKIRAVGVSNFSCEQIAAAREFGPICCLQPPFSLLQRRAEKELLPFCQEQEMGVMAYSPLARGLLTGKFSETSQFTSGIRVRDPEFLGRRYRRNLRIVAGLADIAAGYDKTVAQLAINWVATHPGVTTAVFGAKRPSQVTENAAAVGWLISEPDRARIERLVSEEDLEP